MGILIAGFWSIQQPYFAVLGILVMAWGDGLAAVIGSKFGKHPYQILGNKKSIEGTTTMLLVSFIISSLILLNTNIAWEQQVGISLLVAIAATALESFAQFGIDNLLVPLGSAAIAFYLSQYFLAI
jgi:phytol kinase